MINHYKKIVLLYWKEKKPKLYRELKKEGKLEKEAENMAKLISNEIVRITGQLAEKNQGQAESIAEELVLHDYLPN